MLKLEDFKKFSLEKIIFITGGQAENGTYMGSNISVGGATSYDVHWDGDDDVTCGALYASGDGSSDDVIGDRVSQAL